MNEYENQKHLTSEEYNNDLIEKQMSLDHFNLTGEYLKFEIYKAEKRDMHEEE